MAEKPIMNIMSKPLRALSKAADDDDTNGAADLGLQRTDGTQAFKWLNFILP